MKEIKKLLIKFKILNGVLIASMKEWVCNLIIKKIKTINALSS